MSSSRPIWLENKTDFVYSNRVTDDLIWNLEAPIQLPVLFCLSSGKEKNNPIYNLYR